MAYGNPPFTFRLARERSDKLKEVAKIYGSPSASEFVREMIDTIIGGDPQKITAFLIKFQESLARQTIEEMRLAVEGSTKPRKPKSALPRAKEGKARA